MLAASSIGCSASCLLLEQLAPLPPDSRTRRDSSPTPSSTSTITTPSSVPRAPPLEVATPPAPGLLREVYLSLARLAHELSQRLLCSSSSLSRGGGAAAGELGKGGGGGGGRRGVVGGGSGRRRVLSVTFLGSRFLPPRWAVAGGRGEEKWRGGGWAARRRERLGAAARRRGRALVGCVVLLQAMGLANVA